MTAFYIPNIEFETGKLPISIIVTSINCALDQSIGREIKGTTIIQRQNIPLESLRVEKLSTAKIV